MSHIIQATPELLEGWQGPIVVDGEPMVLLGGSPEQWGHMPLWDVSRPKSGMFGLGTMLCGSIQLDLAVPAARDRVLRVIGQRVGLDPFGAPVLHVSVRCGIVAALYLNDGSTWHGLHNPDWADEGPQLPALSTFPEDLPDEPDLSLACIRMLWESLCEPASSDKLPAQLSGGAE